MIESKLRGHWWGRSIGCAALLVGCGGASIDAGAPGANGGNGFGGNAGKDAGGRAGNSDSPSSPSPGGGTSDGPGSTPPARLPPPTCPATKPFENEVCVEPAESGPYRCEYGAQCGGGFAECRDGHWHTAGYAVDCRPMCPTDVPKNGSACPSGFWTQPCTYAPDDPCKTVFAGCVNNTWELSEYAISCRSEGEAGAAGQPAVDAGASGVGPDVSEVGFAGAGGSRE